VDQIAQRWRRLGAVLVLVALGVDGAVAFDPGAMPAEPAVPVPVVDPVGGGDALTARAPAGLQHASLLDLTTLTETTTSELTALVSYANLVSALTCTRPGADPPRPDELDSWRRRTPGGRRPPDS